MNIQFPTDNSGQQIPTLANWLAGGGDSDILRDPAAAIAPPPAKAATVLPCKVLRVHEDTAGHWPDRRAIDAIEVVPYAVGDSKFKIGSKMFYDVLPDSIPVDQSQYLVAPNDLVWVCDGPQPWYRTRFEPFIAKVTTVNSTNVTVRMLELTGDPDHVDYEGVVASTSAVGSLTGADVVNPRPGLTVASGTYFDFEHVRPLRALRDESHDLVEDDKVLVFQRGRYLLCVDDKKSDPFPMGTLMMWAGEATDEAVEEAWGPKWCLADGRAITNPDSMFDGGYVPDSRKQKPMGVYPGSATYGTAGTNVGTLLSDQTHLLTDITSNVTIDDHPSHTHSMEGTAEQAASDQHTHDGGAVGVPDSGGAVTVAQSDAMGVFGTTGSHGPQAHSWTATGDDLSHDDDASLLVTMVVKWLP